jgi:hypothetical protein
VERDVAGKLKRLRQALRGRLEREVKKRWQSQIRPKAGSRRPPEAGWSSPPVPVSGSTPPEAPPTTPAYGTSSKPLPPEYADKLFSAREQGKAENQLRQMPGIGAVGDQALAQRERHAS